MFCPNCGLSNADNARFCANCGTSLGAGGAAQQPPPPPPPSPGAWQQQAPGSGYVNPSPVSGTGGSPFTPRNIGLGCLILLVVFLLFQGACVRACFHHRSYSVHRRYA